jgi:N-acetylglucosamine kinase-like BadF-type ATPase
MRRRQGEAYEGGEAAGTGKRARARDLSLLVGADVGNSKTDVVLVRPDGTLLAAVRGDTASHQRVGMEAGAATLRGIVDAARAAAGLPAVAGPTADLAVVCAAGADFRDEIARLAGLFRAAGVAREVIVRNDTDAALHAGSSAGWGVAVVCGAGINCLAVAPDGREARYPALGPISGDRGGGAWLGAEALAAAVRARDGRGPRTELERLVPARFGLRRPIDVTMAIYRERLVRGRLRELAPDVFAAAASGDAVARAIADALADEVVAMAGAAIRRLRLTRSTPPVVLAGGVFRADDPEFFARIATGLQAIAPGAPVHRLEAAPVLGAAQLALAAAGVSRPTVIARLQAAIRGAAFVGAGEAVDGAAAAGTGRSGPSTDGVRPHDAGGAAGPRRSTR